MQMRNDEGFAGRRVGFGKRFEGQVPTFGAHIDQRGLPPQFSTAVKLPGNRKRRARPRRPAGADRRAAQSRVQLSPAGQTDVRCGDDGPQFAAQKLLMRAGVSAPVTCTKERFNRLGHRNLDLFFQREPF